MTKKALANLLILIGSLLFVYGIYNIGYHNGLERLRSGDSGLGGLMEWGGAWTEIMLGVVISAIGLLTKSKRTKNRVDKD